MLTAFFMFQTMGRKVQVRLNMDALQRHLLGVRYHRLGNTFSDGRGQSQARRDAWTKNAKDIKEFVLACNHSVVLGHLEDCHKWTTEELLDYPIKYIATYEEALKMNTND
ncbi:hypothetical protein CPC16_002073 [Podila verticillata]|nr:hypothetical protein CPC16_002073 [Podila verticillata]